MLLNLSSGTAATLWFESVGSKTGLLVDWKNTTHCSIPGTIDAISFAGSKCWFSLLHDADRFWRLLWQSQDRSTPAGGFHEILEPSPRTKGKESNQLLMIFVLVYIIPKSTHYTSLVFIEITPCPGRDSVSFQR